MSPLPEQKAQNAALTLDFALATDIGCRENQEDYAMFIPMDGAAEGGACSELFFALADGMGGMAGGEIASQLVVRAFTRHIKESAASGMGEDERMVSALRAADAALGKRKEREPDELSSMGCTFCGVWVREQRLHFISAGDSLIFFLRGSKFYLLNQLHNHREDMRRMAEREGRDWSELQHMPDIVQYGSRITSYIGGEGIAQTDVPDAPLPLQPGDCILVASDGLLTLSHERIAAILRYGQQSFLPATRITNMMMNAVLDIGKPRQDNVTFGLIQIK